MGKPPKTVCHWLAQHPPTGAKCRCVHPVLLGKVRQKRLAHRVPCWAGLTELGVPVIIHNQHIATLVCSRVARRPVPPRVVRHVAAQLGRQHTGPLRAAYRQAKIIPVDLQHLHRHLLETVAHRLGDIVRHLLIANHGKEPDCVRRAKEFL